MLIWSCLSSGVRLVKAELTLWFVILVNEFLSHGRLPGDVKIRPHQMWKLAALPSKQAGQDEATVRKVMGSLFWLFSGRTTIQRSFLWILLVSFQMLHSFQQIIITHLNLSDYQFCITEHLPLGSLLVYHALCIYNYVP